MAYWMSHFGSDKRSDGTLINEHLDRAEMLASKFVIYGLGDNID